MAPVPVTLGRTGDGAGPGPALPDPRPLTAPAQFHVLAKPTGPICNLDCEYCFFLSKEALYPGDRFRMSDDLLATYMPPVDRVAGRTDGDHRVAGRRAHAHGRRLLPSGGRVGRVVRPPRPDAGRTPSRPTAPCSPTSGASCSAQHRFLVGLSIDGRRGHARHLPRRQARRRPPTTRCSEGSDLLKAHGVDWNMLCTVNAANQDHPLDVYRFFRDELRRHPPAAHPHRRARQRHRVPGGQPGHRPLGRPRRVGRTSSLPSSTNGCATTSAPVFVQHFDAALAIWVGAPAIDVHLRRDVRRTQSRSSTTATCTRAITSSSPTTWWATSPRPTWWS